MIDKFNIRIYGLLVKDDKILVSRERIDQFDMLKFPGGGLEFGEGLVEGLKREFKEELDLDLMVYDLIHITEGFIQSTFRSNEQVIAIYYLVDTVKAIKSMTISQSTGIGSMNHLEFEWRAIKEDLLQHLSFESDKIAFKKLLNRFN